MGREPYQNQTSLDEEVNAAARGTITKLNSERSKVQVYLIPTDEELVIAKDTESIVKALQKATPGLGRRHSAF